MIMMSGVKKVKHRFGFIARKIQKNNPDIMSGLFLVSVYQR